MSAKAPCHGAVPRLHLGFPPLTLAPRSTNRSTTILHSTIPLLWRNLLEFSVQEEQALLGVRYAGRVSVACMNVVQYRLLFFNQLRKKRKASVCLTTLVCFVPGFRRLLSSSAWTALFQRGEGQSGWDVSSNTGCRAVVADLQEIDGRDNLQ